VRSWHRINRQSRRPITELLLGIIVNVKPLETFGILIAPVPRWPGLWNGFSACGGTPTEASLVVPMVEHTEPHAIIGLNAGLVNYSQWHPLLWTVHFGDIPFGVTEYMEESVETQAKAIPQLLQITPRGSAASKIHRRDAIDERKKYSIRMRQEQCRSTSYPDLRVSRGSCGRCQAKT
jgi:hypothetical protein